MDLTMGQSCYMDRFVMVGDSLLQFQAKCGKNEATSNLIVTL